MAVDRASLLSRAICYGEENNISIIPTPELGWGQDGFVWKTLDKTAVKVFERDETFALELECYERLRAHDVTTIGVFAVPRLIRFSEHWRIIEMTIVDPPCLLDFGKVHLDRMPDYDAALWASIEEERQQIWGERYTNVRMAIAKLRRLGIHYVDATPRNIMFMGWEPEL